MSKAVKTIVSVAAAVAIPFAAPMIASSIGLSTAIAGAVGSATAGSVIGGAITGAALGAVKGAVLGEDVGRSALMGGIGGGIGGYTAAPTATSTSPYSLAGGTSAAPAGTGITTAAAPSYSLGGTGTGTGLTLGGSSGAGLTVPGAATATTAAAGGAGLSAAMAPVDYSLTAGMQFPAQGLNPAAAGIGFRAPDPGFFTSSVDRALAAGTPIDYSLAAGMPSQQGLQVVSVNPVTGGTQVTTGAGTYQSATPTTQYAGGSYVGPTGAAATPVAQGGTGAMPSTAVTATGQPKTFADALAKVPETIANKFKDPNALADLTLRAAGQLAGSAIAGDGLSAEERALLDAQTEELRRLQQENAALFAQRLEQAQALIGESKYFDPEYFGLQRARRAQIAGARAKRAGLRGLTGGAREAEARRFDLATGRDVGTAFDQGYGTGISGRLQTMKAGLDLMPREFPSSMDAYTKIRGAYDEAEQRRLRNVGGYQRLFGSFTETPKASSGG